jgi:hypothetical protein
MLIAETAQRYSLKVQKIPEDIYFNDTVNTFQNEKKTHDTTVDITCFVFRCRLQRILVESPEDWPTFLIVSSQLLGVELL